MARIFKIHPSVGVARVGQSTAGFFLAPESPGGARHEIDDNGDIPFTGFKDSEYLMRRQAARFRVYEYEDDGAETQTLIGEVNPTQATIRWTVNLASSKAAGPRMMLQISDLQSERIIARDPSGARRNTPPNGFTAADLAAQVSFTVTGPKQVAPTQMGKIAGKDLFIGAARTDHSGRLVVLGGFGVAQSWSNNAPALGDFLNNPTWYDDIADGSVDAVLLSPSGQELPHKVAGSWVLVGPPDFAPDVAPVVSLYDVMFDAMVRANRLTRPKTSFVDDILPLLQRVAGLQWVNDHSANVWEDVHAVLGDANVDLSDPAGDKTVREKVLKLLKKMTPQNNAPLTDFRFTKVQLDALDDWVKGGGNFLQGSDPSRPKLNEAQELDKAVLSAAIGSGFFPGIEAGFTSTRPTLYSEPFRITRGQFTDFAGETRTPEPGFMTQRMACPWQADFTECLRNWWPAQRPDIARFDENLAPVEEHFWDRGVLVGNDEDNANQPKSKANMVARVHKLGVIERVQVAGKEAYAEKGRDPNLPATG